jgi:serine O-acetyltransferase
MPAISYDSAMFQKIKEDINCILARDPAAKSRLEVVTCYPGLHAIWVHRIAHRLWLSRLHWLARFVSQLGRLFTGVEIHPGATIGSRVFIDHGYGVVIGETAQVGDDCTIYQGVTLGGTRLYKGEKRHPTLGNGVVVGAGAQVLGGFVVGDGARIGSNAVVVKPVPAGATAVGNPARVILPNQQAETGSELKPDSASAASQCQEGPLNTKPLQEILATQTARQHPGSEPPAQDQEGFSAYAVDAGDTDPLVRVLHELIDHTAKQDARIEQLCKTIESMGKKISPSVNAEFDPDRLNKLVD